MSSASNGNSKSKNIDIFTDSILKTLEMKKFNSLLKAGVAHLDRKQNNEVTILQSCRNI